MAGLRNTLQIRTTQTQSQIMTPQMQQAIKLLQLSTIELQQQIRQTVDLNPMLEIDDSSISGMEESLEDLVERENEEADDVFDDDASVRSFEIDGSMGKLQIGENGETYTEKSSHDDYESSSSADSSKDSLENSSSTDEQLSGIENSSASSRSSKGIAVDGDDIFEGETVETLHDHLLWQLNLSPLTGMDRTIAEIIIDAIDDSGYLSESIDEIRSCVEKSYPDVTLEDIHAVLKLIQHYDPIGVGSRNVQECMLIQLNEIKSDDPVLTSAITLVSEHINLLANRDFRTICQKLSIKEDFLKKVLDLITSLKPRPGNLNFSKKNEFVVPDVVVLKNSNGEYTAELNPVANTKVRINEHYRMLADKAQSKEERQFFKDHLQEASWFIQSIEKRNDTLLKVARCIVKHQKDFMDKGAQYMHPMVLNDVATEIEMHESSISRITTQKYIHTPKGTFELKYFFSSSVSTSDGGDASSTAIKAKIKEYISKENPRKPLSDSKLADLLNDDGMNVARRTVAKYREALGIASSSMRKQLV